MSVREDHEFGAMMDEMWDKAETDIPVETEFAAILADFDETDESDETDIAPNVDDYLASVYGW